MPNVKGKAILAPLNKDVDELNDIAVKLMPAQIKELVDGADHVEMENPDDALQYPSYFLHSLQPPELPPHSLQLKFGAVVILLRNLNPKRGFCNGTRMRIFNMTNWLLHVEILNGSCENQTAYIPLSLIHI